MKTLEQHAQLLSKDAVTWEAQGTEQPYVPRGNPHYILGGFFEHLAARLIGGRVLYNPRDNNELNPDIFDSSSGTWREVKASRMGGHFNLVISQTQKYDSLEMTEPVEYILFRHRVQNTSKKRLQEEIFQLAAQSNKLAVVLPGFVIHQAIRAAHPFTSIFPHFGNGVYTLSSSFVQSLIEQPEKTVKQIGMPPECFSYEAYTSPELTVLGQAIKPFPFRYIKEKISERQTVLLRR